LESPTQPVVVSGDGFPVTEEYYTYTQTETGAILQRLVANGMMMVAVQPKDVSPIFTSNAAIKTLLDTNVRLGPGTNYGVIQSVPANTTGIIYGEDNGLNGIWAKGAYWWRVLLELPGGIDLIGWVSEPYLTNATE
jgi:Bacterial SH3 domain